LPCSLRTLQATQKQKDLAAFGGVGGDDDDGDGEMLADLKNIHMNISFPVAGEIPMPILAVDNVSFHYVSKCIDIDLYIWVYV